MAGTSGTPLPRKLGIEPGARVGLWIAWPKRSSGHATDLSDVEVRRRGLALGLVDNKVCAIDETWSGLRFVVRLAERPPRAARSARAARR